MHSRTTPGYLLAVSVSTLGHCAVGARLTPADVLHFAMTAEKTWRRAHPSQSTRVPVVEQSKRQIRLI